MELIIDQRVQDFTDTLSDHEQGRVLGYVEVFKERKFSLSSKYLKKLDKNLWELRPGNLRLLLGKAGDRIVIVNIFKKKSQKTPISEIKTAKSRLKEYGL